jgi:hypothetical protein
VAIVLTLLLTFCVVLVAIGLFWALGSPVYRVEKENIISLLELVLSGQATESDWDVFAAYPIRHDDYLADVQNRCLQIAEREYIGGREQLFTRAGREQLQRILAELKNIKPENL